MTGGLLQAINGIILLSLFFAVRVCYGIYMVGISTIRLRVLNIRSISVIRFLPYLDGRPRHDPSRSSTDLWRWQPRLERA